MPELPRPEKPAKPEPTPQPAPVEESTGMSLFSNALAIIGFIIIAVIVIWGLVHFISLASPWFGSLFARPAAAVQIDAPASATSGDPITISWNYTGTGGGSSSLLYQCEPNFQFAVVSSNSMLQQVPCGVGWSVGSTTSATMVPLLAGSSTEQVSLTVVFTPTASGTAQAEGSATLSVIPGNAQPQQTQPTQPVTTTQPAQTVSPSQPAQPSAAPVGSADISVSIITVGVIDPSSGALLNETPTSPAQTIGVEFDIRNNGPEATGPYVFQAHLPTETPYTYTSPVQNSLQPGAHVVNTLRFTEGVPNGIFTVDVDTGNQVNDPNRANNEAATTIY